MRKKSLQQIKILFRKKPRAFSFEPVTHQLNPNPVLPQGLMSAIAPAYEETLAKEQEKKTPLKPQE